MAEMSTNDRKSIATNYLTKIQNLVALIAPKSSGLISVEDGFFALKTEGLMPKIEKEVCDYLLGAIEIFLRKKSIDSKVSVDSKDCIDATDDSIEPIVFTAIYLQGEELSKSDFHECQNLVKYLVIGIRCNEELFDSQVRCDNLKDKHDGIYSALVENFVSKAKGKKITDPVSVVLSSGPEDRTEILLSESFRNPTIIQSERNRISGYAVMNGYDESAGLIFLLHINQETMHVSSRKTEYICKDWATMDLAHQIRKTNLAIFFEGFSSKSGLKKEVREIERITAIEREEIPRKPTNLEIEFPISEENDHVE